MEQEEYQERQKMVFYIIRCFDDDESFYKVGITRNNIQKRYSDYGAMPYKFEMIKRITGIASHIMSLENNYKRALKEHHYIPAKSFGGSLTECFKTCETSDIGLLELENRIKKIERKYGTTDVEDYTIYVLNYEEHDKCMDLESLSEISLESFTEEHVNLKKKESGKIKEKPLMAKKQVELNKKNSEDGFEDCPAQWL